MTTCHVINFLHYPVLIQLISYINATMYIVISFLSLSVFISELIIAIAVVQF